MVFSKRGKPEFPGKIQSRYAIQEKTEALRHLEFSIFINPPMNKKALLSSNEIGHIVLRGKGEDFRTGPHVIMHTAFVLKEQ